MKPGLREPIKAAGAILALFCAVAWFFAPLLSGDAIVAERDALSAVLPAKLYLARGFAAGEMPWWNPLPALGKPFFADPLPGVLYPANLLLLVSPFARGYGLFLVAQYLWTAIGAYLCLRVCPLPRLAALLGALVWTLGGALASLANVANHLCAIAWLPWVLYAWSRPRRLSARLPWSALAMAPAFLAGSPEMVALIAASLLLWTGDARVLLVPPLAAGLAAVEVVPIFQNLAETYRGTRGIDLDAAMRFSATPAQIAQLVRATGALAPPTFLTSVYVGPLVLVLALIGLGSASRRRLLVLSAAAALVILVALGPYTPVFPMIFRFLPLRTWFAIRARR